MREGKAIDPVMHKFSHAARVSGDHRHASLLSFMDDQGRVLHPDGGHYDAVHLIKDFGHDGVVPIAA